MHHLKRNIMKNPIILIFAAIIMIPTISGKEVDNNSDVEINNGFSLVINDSITYNSKHIDFYDFSSNLIYLKDGYNFSSSGFGTFKVLVDNEEIYTGRMHSMLSSRKPSGPVIQCAPSFYNDYIIPIRFYNGIEYPSKDPRADLRIIKALKEQNQYKKGLACEILSVQRLSNNKIKINLQLTNFDSDKLLFLDQDKMGLELFHFFTHGLVLKDSLNNTFMHNLTTKKPEPWDAWQNDWLSEINSNETKTISITYNSFGNIPVGQYTTIFEYPGLRYQVDKDELLQDNGRIWLGELHTTKLIDIE
jgi:hypothetical protein